MKICMLTSSFPRTKNDYSGFFIYELAENLIIKGVQVVVVAPHDRGCKFFEKSNGMTIYRFPYFVPLKFQQLAYGNGILKNLQANPAIVFQIPLFVISQIIITLFVVKKKRVDLIHAHWSIPQGLAGGVLSSLTGIPSVLSVHGSDVFGLNRSVLKTLNTFALKKNDKLTANSRATSIKSREISGRMPDGIIPMGVNTAKFSKREGTELKKHLKIDGAVVLYAGRLNRQKGVEYLIGAMPTLFSEFPDLTLLIVGDGMEKEALEQQVALLHIEDRVVFTGAVGHGDMYKYYNIADICVMPSVVSEKGEEEGLGVVLMEAMASGVPVVGSRTGGVTDIILDGESGLLSEPESSDDIANKIRLILSDKKLADRLKTAGEQRILKKFTWDIVCDQFIDLYNVACLKKASGNKGQKGP